MRLVKDRFSFEKGINETAKWPITNHALLLSKHPPLFLNEMNRRTLIFVTNCPNGGHRSDIAPTRRISVNRVAQM